jgi:riboflavin synthase
MFTGIVETTATVASLAPTDGGARLVLEGVAFAAELAIGESVAVNGCCLTVVSTGPQSASFDLLRQTLDVTNLGAVTSGQLVNLERALAAGARLSGHFVQGHIDETAEVLRYEPSGSDHVLTVRIPPGRAGLLIPRGSITVDGVSLTIASLRPDAFTCWIIPHTHGVTALHSFSAGRLVNLEFDMMVKAIDHILALRAEPSGVAREEAQ